MMATKKEFKYGDPLADVGTEGWAQRVHVVLLSSVDGAKFSVHNVRCHLDKFLLEHGWRKLKQESGKPFIHFRDYVEQPKPFGLGTDYSKFRAMLASEVGEREFDRLTASEPKEAGRPANSENTRHDGDDYRTPREASRLRAINRAPAVVQQLYDQDLLAVDLAAKFGPANKEQQGEMEGRAKALQQRLETFQVFQPNLPAPKLKREMNQAAREILDLKMVTPLNLLQKTWKKASKAERSQFVEWIGSQNGGEL